MMLRSRNSSNVNIINNQKPGEVKRGKKQSIVAGEDPLEPKAKRPAFADLSRAISNVVIDSSKKLHLTKDSRRNGRRSKTQSENSLPSITESSDSEELKPAVEPDPCPAYDYDAESGPDIANVSEFAFDIFRYYKSREKQFHTPDYLSQHPNLSKQTRAVLADWMVEVCFSMADHRVTDIDDDVVHMKWERTRAHLWMTAATSQSETAVLHIQTTTVAYMRHRRSGELCGHRKVSLGNKYPWEFFQIQETFELNHETLYMSVKIVDMYLSKTKGVVKDDLQLLASAAIFIACKFEERSPPLIDDFMYVCEEMFNREQMIRMEMKVLDTINYDIGFPLSYRNVRRYARVTKTDMPKLTLARYILETSLMFYEFIGVSESLMAAAAILLALKMHDKETTWTPILQKYSGYKAEDVEPLMWELNHMLHKRRVMYDRLETVFSKYSHEVFFSVAAVPLLPDVYTLERPVQAPPSSSPK